MSVRVGCLALLLVCGAGCRHAAAPVAIPPPAAASPLSLPDPADEEPSEPVAPALPRRCEAPAKTSVASPDFAVVRRRIDSVLEWSGAPSVAVAVARDGEILWEEGFGWVDRRRRKRADEHTMYSLASVSKPFIATAVMVLREQGKLRLEQPLSELLPAPGIRSGVGDAAEATVERVASHTAGLPLHWQFYYADRDEGPPSLAQTREHYAVTVSEPGQRYRYSNLGYGLLGQAVAEQVGVELPAAMKSLVFEPLDLRHTFVGRPPRGAGVEAPRYGLAGHPLPDYGFDHDGASALYSSAHDLVRFGMFHVGQATSPQQEILPRGARERMWKPVAPAESYGLGWGTARVDGVTFVGHGGGMPGVRTILRMLPEQGVVVVVLANASIGDEPGQIHELIVDALGIPARGDDICALPAGHALLGSYSGQVETVAGPRPMRLEVASSGEVRVALGDAPPRFLRRVRFADGMLSGLFVGDASAELAEGHPTTLGLELWLRDDGLEGGVSATVPWVSTTTLFARLERDPS